MDCSKLKVGSILYRLDINSDFSITLSKCKICKINEYRIHLDDGFQIYASPYFSDSTPLHSSTSEMNSTKSIAYKTLGYNCFYHSSKRKIVKYILKKLKIFLKQEEHVIKSLEKRGIWYINEKECTEEKLRNQEYCDDINKELRKGMLYYISSDLNIVLGREVKVIGESIDFRYVSKVINKDTSQINSHTLFDSGITYYTTKLEASRILKIRNLDQAFTICQQELEKHSNILEEAKLLYNIISEYDLERCK